MVPIWFRRLHHQRWRPLLTPWTRGPKVTAEEAAALSCIQEPSLTDDWKREEQGRIEERRSFKKMEKIHQDWTAWGVWPLGRSRTWIHIRGVSPGLRTHSKSRYQSLEEDQRSSELPSSWKCSPNDPRYWLPDHVIDCYEGLLNLNVAALLSNCSKRTNPTCLKRCSSAPPGLHPTNMFNSGGWEVKTLT